MKAVLFQASRMLMFLVTSKVHSLVHAMLSVIQTSDCLHHDCRFFVLWRLQLAQQSADASFETADKDHASDVRCALSVLSMAAAVQPDIIVDNLDALLEVPAPHFLYMI